MIKGLPLALTVALVLPASAADMRGPAVTRSQVCSALSTQIYILNHFLDEPRQAALLLTSLSAPQAKPEQAAAASLIAQALVEPQRAAAIAQSLSADGSNIGTMAKDQLEWYIGQLSTRDAQQRLVSALKPLHRTLAGSHAQETLDRLFVNSQAAASDPGNPTSVQASDSGRGGADSRLERFTGKTGPKQSREPRPAKLIAVGTSIGGFIGVFVSAAIYAATVLTQSSFASFPFTILALTLLAAILARASPGIWKMGSSLGKSPLIGIPLALLALAVFIALLASLAVLSVLGLVIGGQWGFLINSAVFTLSLAALTGHQNLLNVREKPK